MAYTTQPENPAEKLALRAVDPNMVLWSRISLRRA